MPFLTRNVRLKNGVTLGYHEWDGRIIVGPNGETYIAVKSWVDQASHDASEPQVQEKRIQLVKANIASALATFKAAITGEVGPNLATYLDQIR